MSGGGVYATHPETGGETRFLTTLEAGSEWQARNALLRQPLPPSLRSYLQ